MQILRQGVESESDVFLLRQRGREIAAAVGFDTQDQVRVATALSEVGREVLAAGGGWASMQVEHEVVRPELAVELVAAGTLAFPDRSSFTGLSAAQRLMDGFEYDGRSRVLLRKRLPGYGTASAPSLTRLRERIAAIAPVSPLDELRAQNANLATALEQVQRKQEELLQLNEELQDTNRGVMAMYAQLWEELDETNRGVVALYAELDEKGVALQHANEAKTRFLANVSHELRTPVNSVLGLAGLLRSDSDALTDEQRRQVAYIEASARDLLRLVNELLDLAKAESGRLEPTVAPIDLARLLADLHGTLRPLATNADVALVIEEPPAVEGFASDPELLVHVLRNLVTNGLKFTERGEVRLTTEVDRNVGCVHLAVRDTGIGIPVEEQEKVFEEFYQVASPLQTRMRGTGLGLPFARRLVELLGGQLRLQSTPGVGSVFTVSLPLRPVPPPHPTKPHEPGDVSPRGIVARQVLVVDDDEAYRHVLSTMLQGIAGHVLEARNGAEALDILARNVPNLVLLDLRMPGIDGAQVLARIAEEPAWRDLPVVVTTSARLDSTVLERTALACAVVPKASLTPHTLRELVAAHAGRTP